MLTMVTAFNAGLVLIAALLVAMKTNDTENVQEQPVWRFLNNPTMYLNMAIEALQNLDRGNRVVQRMVDYLSQLTIAVPNLREFDPFFDSKSCRSLLLSKCTDDVLEI